MNWRRIVGPILVIAILGAAWSKYGWHGLALAAGALVMWGLLYFNKMMNVLGKAAKRPKGFVGSAVMMNAKLKPGLNLLQVMTMTQSIGEALTPQGTDPELFRWTDGTDSHVTCEFSGGRLVKWALYRPPTEPEGTDAAAP